MDFNLDTASRAGLVKEHEGGKTGAGGSVPPAGKQSPAATGFAALLAGDDAWSEAAGAPLATASENLDRLAMARALAELAQEFPAGEDGNVLPPGGLPLPLVFQPNQPGGPGGGTDGARLSGAPTDPLARMLSLVQLLQLSASDTPPGAAGVSALAPAGTELARVELVEMPRASLPLVALPAAATVGGSAAPSGEQAQPPTFPLAAQPGRPEWGAAVGERVLWMAANRVQVAQLRLNPPELGPVEVRVRLEDDSLRLAFAASTNGAREALEAAAPRLREIFMAEGLQLGSLDIEQRERGDRQESDGEASAADSGGENGDRAPENDATPRLSVQRAGLVDLFV